MCIRDRVNSGSYTGSTVSYNSNNKWDQERAERERQEREADQRAKARYDARTNQLKAEYDACLLYTSIIGSIERSYFYG